MKAPELYFSGRVQTVVYENSDSAYYVLRVMLDEGSDEGGGNLVSVTGEIPGLRVQVGSWFGFEARWVNDPKYGRQLKVTRAPVIRGGWDGTTCEKILVSQGIGPGIAQRLRAALGEDMVGLLADPVKVGAVEGITPFLAEMIVGKWRAVRAQFMTLEFLADLGLPSGRVRQIFSIFGDEASAVLSSNPWALTQVDGVTFADSDLVARRLKLDCTAGNPLRVQGAVLHACRSARGFGHLYVSSGDLLRGVRQLDPLFTDSDIADAVRELASRELLVADRTTAPGTLALYEPWLYRIEVDSARLLNERRLSAVMEESVRSRCVQNLVGEESTLSLREAGRQYLEVVRSSGGITLSELQQESVLNALEHPVTLITGLPGTGKTTCLRMAVSLLREAGLSVLIVAPTGIAAKRVSSVTGSVASTIHRAFGARGIGGEKREATYAGVVGEADSDVKADGSDEVWSYGPSNPHPAEVVIVDESSMLDQHVLYRVLSCTRPQARLVFVGDAAQLPSVGPGRVLRDLMDSKLYSTVSLTEIYRQADTSPIIRAAHDIHAGRVPEAPLGSDFCLLPLETDNAVADAVVRVAVRLYETRTNFQVLSPRHGGSVGVTALNTRLRELLNPRQPSLQEVSLGSEVLREGDRVMVVANDYTLSVFNGDVGKVVAIDRRASEIEVKIHGPPAVLVRVPYKKAKSLLRLAYAVTVHRCQGLEYDVIVMPMVRSFAHQLQRNLIYTAVTRAKRRVYLVGSSGALAVGVANDREGARNTLFRQRLS